jgi:hypothetical protein
MLNYGDALYEVELRRRDIERTHRAVAAAVPVRRERRSLASMFREGLARLGDLLITVGCELEIRYLTEGRATPCAG